MNGFGLMLDTNDRKEALRQVRKWVDKELGEPTTSIKVEGNKTTVTLPDGRVGVSRCNPCDKFDIITGVRVALDDIEKKSRKLSAEEIKTIKMAQNLGATILTVYRYNTCLNTIEFVNDDFDEILIIKNDDLFNWVDSAKHFEINDLLRKHS